LVENGAVIAPTPVEAPEAKAPPPGLPPIPAGFVLDQPAVTAEEPGFLARSAQQLRERGANLADIFAAQAAEEQTTPETIFQTVGTQIGALGDIIGEGVVSGARALPEEVKEPVVAGVNALLDTDAGRAGLRALGEGVEQWEKFKEENPRAARNIEAAFNVGLAFTPVKGVSAAGVARKGVEASARRAKELTARVPVVTSEDISTLASNTYKQADQLGGTLQPQIAENFLDEINKIKPQTKLGKAIAGDTEFTKVMDRLEVLRGQPITLTAAQEIDEALGDSIDNFFREGRLTKEGKKLLDIQTSFRESIEKASAKGS
jgi:hypothetical protein